MGLVVCESVAYIQGVMRFLNVGITNVDGVKSGSLSGNSIGSAYLPPFGGSFQAKRQLLLNFFPLFSLY